MAVHNLTILLNISCCTGDVYLPDLLCLQHANFTDVNLFTHDSMVYNEQEALALQVDLPTITFSVGSVPVWIDVLARLEGAACATGDLTGSFSAGAAISATTRMGVTWDGGLWVNCDRFKATPAIIIGAVKNASYHPHNIPDNEANGGTSGWTAINTNSW